MNQIKSIQLGVIAICIATVPLSLAQTPRTRTSGSNQTTTTAAPIHTGSNRNSIRAPQIGVNSGIPTITGATPNIGAHTAINAGVQTGISNQGTGITRAVTGNSVSIGNSLGATQTGINAGSATNIGAHTAINAGAQTGVSNQATGMTGAAMGNGGSSGNSTGGYTGGNKCRNCKYEGEHERRSTDWYRRQKYSASSHHRIDSTPDSLHADTIPHVDTIRHADGISRAGTIRLGQPKSDPAVINRVSATFTLPVALLSHRRDRDRTRRAV
jgi:hypothetical protein